MKIDVKTTGLEQLQEALERLDQVTRAETVRDVAQRLYQRVQVDADKHTKTGALARSVDMVRQPDGWFIGHNPGPAYTLFVHWGARPHDIRPKRKRSLRWTGGGKFIFAKRVKHPGYPGDPYIARAAQTVPQLFAAAVARRISS